MTGGTGAVGAGLEDAKMERKNWRNEDPFTMMYTLYNLHRYTLDVPVYNNWCLARDQLLPACYGSRSLGHCKAKLTPAPIRTGQCPLVRSIEYRSINQ
jgi:hypothetical protein